MGKGDQRSRRGKLFRGTFGKSRPRKKATTKKKAPVARTPLAAKRPTAPAAPKKAPRKTTPPAS